MTTSDGPHPSSPATDEELVVLLDDEGRPCGTRRKADVHGPATPLHLAFSCWVLDAAGRVLVTRRATSKRTWPGVWTNAFCGHPGPDEPVDVAVRRRARQELAIDVRTPRLALPHFRYRAVMIDGTVENEVCPVYVVRVTDPRVDPDRTEVAAHVWTTLEELTERVSADPGRYSPWFLLQFPQLLAQGSLTDGRN